MRRVLSRRRAQALRTGGDAARDEALHELAAARATFERLGAILENTDAVARRAGLLRRTTAAAPSRAAGRLRENHTPNRPR
jgi:hypothetical protein